MGLQSLLDSMRPALDNELKRQVSRLEKPSTLMFHEMLSYHMGWTGYDAGVNPQGKRIRPLLLLLTTMACGTDWRLALPAAASVELVHNFSLIHDDIEDNSDTRHGRLTVWKKWGIPQAINCGDAVFVLSNLAILDLSSSYPASTILQVSEIFQTSCLNLTIGQYLDMFSETTRDPSTGDYWSMVAGKTAALISACTAIGAKLSQVDNPTLEAYRSFGQYLGLAFQVHDDLLGIWGDVSQTGKSTDSDLVSGKKTLPVLYGLDKNGVFASRYRQGSIQDHETKQLAEQLAQEGAKLFTQGTVDNMTDLALSSLRSANPQGEAGEALFDLANILVNRQN